MILRPASHSRLQQIRQPATTTLLQVEGHEARCAYKGTEVLRMAHLQRFDAVILDMEMPEMSGYAIAQELRTLPPGEASEEAGRAGLQPARKGFSV